MKKIFIVTFILVTAICSTVWGYTGTGKKNDPFVVSSEKDLRATLTEYTNRTSWIYIAVNDTIAITKTIDVTAGKYRIYAIKGNQTIRRSYDLGASVNDKNDPKYCMSIEGDSNVVLGYNASEYKLNLNGNRDIFTNGRECSGWLHVYENAKLTIGVNCHLRNAMNNKVASSTSVITSKGEVVINGEISNCKGINGGAIKIMQGSVTINESAKIHDCVSETEGGAIHSSDVGNIVMNGGRIYNCASKEEGGAIFLKGGATCKIIAGTISNNTSEASAGGVFAGYGAILTVGTTSGNGPEISYNTAAGSGGGIRCDGGNNEKAGGTAYIYGGNIHHNTSGKFGGGIACGAAGKNGTSKLVIKNVTVTNNSSASDGGGIWLPNNAIGTSGKYVTIDNCKIKNNTAGRDGGGIIIPNGVNGSNNEIAGNHAERNGGGVYIDEQGTFVLSSGITYYNTCGNKGSGIYVKGRFKIQADASVGISNNVYLTLGTFIDVIGKLNKTSGYIAQINSKSKENGTVLVRANYAGTTASKELYRTGNADDEYSDNAVAKKYIYYNLGKNRCLRPTEKVNAYGDNYIILSEKYKISYDKNTTDNVEKMPQSQIKFWQENITISDNKIKREGYAVDETKHWNLSADGTGRVVKPGTIYTIDGNKTLYGIWLFWSVSANDRYYMVGQDIELNKNEILKKVIISDDNNGGTYSFKVKKIQNIAKKKTAVDYDIITNNYMDTLITNHYIVTFVTSNSKSDNTIETTMNVFIIDAVISKGQTRFISIDFINTLKKDSKWYISLLNKLRNTLQKTAGGGMYKIEMTNSRLKEIKENVKDNNYIITNSMNKQLAEGW